MSKLIEMVGIAQAQGVEALLGNGEAVYLEFKPGEPRLTSEDAAAYLLKVAPDRFVVKDEKKAEPAESAPAQEAAAAAPSGSGKARRKGKTRRA